MREMAGTEVLAVAEPHGMHRGDVARLAFGKEATFERRQQRFWNGVAAAGTAHQHGVAGADKPHRFIGRYASHGPPPEKACQRLLDRSKF